MGWDAYRVVSVSNLSITNSYSALVLKLMTGPTDRTDHHTGLQMMTITCRPLDWTLAIYRGDIRITFVPHLDP